MRSLPAALVLALAATFLGAAAPVPAAAPALAADGVSAADREARENPRPRARNLGISIGILPPGPLNAITDVAGVLVGQTTIIRGDDVRSGVTAVLPHSGNLFRDKVPGAVFIGNAFGKLAGSTQVDELGEIETPIILTSTLSVPRAADAVLDYLLALPGNEDVQSINPLVAETNDGWLNDIRGRHVRREEVIAAIRGARGGPVEEGSVGAGTGTVAFGFKGGIGTASRRLPESLGGWTVGVLVQTNFGGVLTIAGAPVGRELGRYYLHEELERGGAPAGAGLRRAPDREGPGPPRVVGGAADGSIIIVVATSAPLEARNLRRLAARSIAGLARTGSSLTNGSGDYAIAFSAAPGVRLRTAAPAREAPGPRATAVLGNEEMSPLFQAAIEATEEAIVNSLLRATTITGRGRTVEALPIERTVEILRRHGVIRPPDGRPSGG